MKNYSDFALVINENFRPLVLKYLQDNKVSFKENVVSPYWVVWDLKGNPSAINQLRDLYDESGRRWGAN